MATCYAPSRMALIATAAILRSLSCVVEAMVAPGMTQIPQLVGPNPSTQNSEMASRQVDSIDCSLQGCALRLGPGEELKSRLKEIGRGRSLFVLSCVGSLSSVSLRLAGYVPDSSTSRGEGEGDKSEEKSITPHETTNDFLHLNQHFEILSLVGTICR
eukprot:1664098-Rhodomonas_salina.2